MKGIIFQLFEDVVCGAHGADAWSLILKEADVPGVYTSLGSYPDEELLTLVGTASSRLDMTPEDLIRWFGRGALPILADRYPSFFTPHRSTVPFLLTLNDIIHTEVRKLYPGADVPEFDFNDRGDGVLEMRYRSSRKLCSLAEGLIQGAGHHFGEHVEIEQPHCKLRGDGSCLLVCTFGRS